MGLFNIFKKDKKAESIAIGGKLLGPGFLEEFTGPADDGKRTESFEWRRKLISGSGGKKFRIRYYGRLHDKHHTLIVATAFAPVLIFAIDVVTQQEILLFDACRHGYSAMFGEAFSPAQMKGRSADTFYVDNEGNDCFEIILSAYYQANLDDELLNDVDENGLIRLADKSNIEFEEAKRNAFDVLQIIAINSNGKKIEMLSEEFS